MKLVRLVVLGAVGVIALRVVKGRMGDLCTRMFESMPDDAPPKRMASDLAAIRAQNDRIIDMLEGSAGMQAPFG